MKIKTCYKKTFERLLLLKKGVVLHATTVGQKLEWQLLATAHDKQVPLSTPTNTELTALGDDSFQKPEVLQMPSLFADLLIADIVQLA